MKEKEKEWVVYKPGIVCVYTCTCTLSHPHSPLAINLLFTDFQPIRKRGGDPCVYHHHFLRGLLPRLQHTFFTFTAASLTTHIVIDKMLIALSFRLFIGVMHLFR